MDNNSVECIAPFGSLFITNSGEAKPCCIYTDLHNSFIDPNKDINWNFNKLNAPVREQFISYGNDYDQYKNCRACPSGVLTQRTEIHNNNIVKNINYIENPTLTNLHIKFSNLCNLACRMCDPFSSNLLFKEEQNFVPPKNGITFHNNHLLEPIGRDSVLYKSILDHLDNINHLWFSGGETLLHDQVWEVLKRLYQLGHSKNVTLKINTNGTVKLTDEEISILKSFKQLIIHVSLDGIGALAEYIRTNLVWEKWLDNFNEYRREFADNAVFEVAATYSTFNIHKMLEMYNYFKQFETDVSCNFVYGYRPETMPSNLNSAAREYLFDLYKDYSSFTNHLNHLFAVPPTLTSSELVALIDSRDDHIIANNIYKNYRAFRDVDPDWYNILKQ